MFYLGIDQHARQLTVDLKNQRGDTVLKRLNHCLDDLELFGKRVAELDAAIAEVSARDEDAKLKSNLPSIKALICIVLLRLVDRSKG